MATFTSPAPHSHSSSLAPHSSPHSSPSVGEQEPGTEAEIKAFAAEKGATFPLFEKIWVNGANANPIWDWMKLQPGADGDIAWNFQKFLISRVRCPFYVGGELCPVSLPD